MSEKKADIAGSLRIAYFDNLRVFAVILIIILHTAALRWYDADISGASWLILNAFKSLTDHAVLLFVMISGALFLGRDIPIKKLYLKYVLRLVIAFIVWSFIYALISNYTWGIRSILEVTLASHYHLWFLPMIAGLYICVPIFRLFTKDEKITRYFLVLSFIFAFLIPQLLSILSDFGGVTISQYAGFINDRLDEMEFHLVLGYAFFFMAGYYINKIDLSKAFRRIIYILGAAGVFITFFMTVINARLSGEAVDTYHENFNISILLTCLAVFIFFKYNMGKKESRLMARLSKYTFGVYLVHTLIIEELYSVFGLSALSFNAVLGTVLVSVITLLVSFAISALLNLIPGIKKYIV